MAENTLCRNAALPYPVYGVPWAMIVPLLDADGDPVTSAADLDAEISKNGDTAADIGGTESEVGGGNYLLTFTATDMTANAIGGTLKTSTSGAKATQFALQPRRLPVVASGTCQGGAAGYVTLAAGTVQFDDQFNGCLVVVLIDGTKQARIITDSTASNQQCAVGDEFTTVPDSDDTYEVMVPEGVAYQASDVRAIAGNTTNATNLGTAASNYSATRGLAGTALPAAAADAAGGLPISDAGGLDLDTLLARLDAAITTRHASGAAVAKSPATLDWSADVSNKPTIGTSTLTAQQVWEYATRTLSAFGFTVAATGNWATVSDLSGLATYLQLQALQTHGDTTWSTSTLSAAAVATAILATPANKLATNASGYVTTTNPGTGATAEQVRVEMDSNSTKLASILEDTGTTLPAAIAALDVGSGTGAIPVTITVVVDGTTDPIEGATVSLWQGGTLCASLPTDENGQVVLNVEAGDYTVAIADRGLYQFGGDSLTVAVGMAMPTYEMTELGVTPPTNPDDCACAWLCLDSSDQPTAGVVISARPHTDATGDGIAWSGKIRTATSVAGTGLAVLNLPKGSTWYVRAGTGQEKPYTVPSTATDQAGSVRGGKLDAK